MEYLKKYYGLNDDTIQQIKQMALDLATYNNKNIDQIIDTMLGNKATKDSKKKFLQLLTKK